MQWRPPERARDRLRRRADSRRRTRDSGLTERSLSGCQVVSDNSHQAPQPSPAREICHERAWQVKAVFYGANSVSSGSRSPRSTSRSTSTQSSPRASASVAACGLTPRRGCRGKPRAPGRARMLRGSGRAAPRPRSSRSVDLDRHPAVVPVAAHQVDRADVGRPLAAHEAEIRLERGRAQALPGSTPSSSAASPRSYEVAQHLGDADLEPVFGLAGSFADDEQLGRVAVLLDHGRGSSSSAAWPPLSACTSTEPSDLTSTSRFDSGRTALSRPVR